MTLLLPDLIKTRTILVLLVGLTLSHIGSTLVYSSDRDQALAAANEQMVADKISTLAHLIDMSPEPLRQRVAAAISSPGLKVSWGEVEETSATPADADNSTLIQKSLPCARQSLAKTES